MSTRTCTIDGCDSDFIARGWCHKHYKRWQTHGDPTIVLDGGHVKQREKSFEERFWEKVQVEGGCWVFTGSTEPDGYGRMGRPSDRPGSRLAHRIARELLGCEIPDDMYGDHHCRNKACVNPDHVEPVPPALNCHPSRHPGNGLDRRTHCSRGHRLDVSNEARKPDGYARCRKCKRIRDRRAKRRARRTDSNVEGA